MSKTKWIIGLSVASTLMILIGALAKIQHWESIKPLMLLGLALQMGILLYAILQLLNKKNNQ